MRILRVAQKVYPEVKGGGAYHVHAMSRDQAEMGHEVTVLTVGDGPRMEEREGYTIVRCPSWGSVLGNDLAPGVGRHLLVTDAYDVVHAHSHLYFATNMAALARRLSGTPLAITNHGLYSQSAPKWIFDYYLRTIGRLTFNSADNVFCYTDQDMERLQRIGVTTAIDVVNNGVDTGRFRPGGQTSDRIEHDGFVVLFVGRLVEGKRPMDVVEAVGKIPDSIDAKLYIIGDGPERPELESMADDRVVFLGQVPYDDMPAIYRSADVLVLPSRAEGLPRTILEAFASGVPVVSSDLEQLAPIVTQGGETVALGDVEGYAAAISNILRSPPASEDLREIIRDRYDWRDTVEQTTMSLQELANRS